MICAIALCCNSSERVQGISFGDCQQLSTNWKGPSKEYQNLWRCWIHRGDLELKEYSNSRVYRLHFMHAFYVRQVCGSISINYWASKPNKSLSMQQWTSRRLSDWKKWCGLGWDRPANRQCSDSGTRKYPTDEFVSEFRLLPSLNFASCLSQIPYQCCSLYLTAHIHESLQHRQCTCLSGQSVHFPSSCWASSSKSHWYLETVLGLARQDVSGQRDGW